nr:hypothetical protein CIT39_15830 [Bradyrhizobium symbiodeficiens]
MSISSKMRFAHALAEDLRQFQRRETFNRSRKRSPDPRLRGESRHFMMIDQFCDALLLNLH